MSGPDAVINLKVSRLLPDPDNVNLHSELNVSQIKGSIQRFGFLDPIGVVRSPSRRGYYMIVEGHGRLEAAKALELDEVPCIVLSLDEAARKGYAIAHNQTQKISTIDNQIVADEFARLGVGADDYTSLGFTEEDVLFLPTGHGGIVAPGPGDPFNSPDGKPYEEGEDEADTKEEAWKGFVPPVHRSTLAFSSEIGFNRFTLLLQNLRDRYPVAGTHAERVILYLTDIGAVASDAKLEKAA